MSFLSLKEGITANVSSLPSSATHLSEVDCPVSSEGAAQLRRPLGLVSFTYYRVPMLAGRRRTCHCQAWPAGHQNSRRRQSEVSRRRCVAAAVPAVASAGAGHPLPVPAPPRPSLRHMRSTQFTSRGWRLGD